MRATPWIGFSELAISCASARGGFFSLLGQLEAQWRGDFAHGELRRALEDDGHIDLVALVDVVPQRFANSVFDHLIHAWPRTVGLKSRAER